ncbi:MAG: hypothetical protein K2X87_17170 [Gemmataceae bacterium]|nr:hypothetical protein [Gemmataceae bacterium]
MGRLTALVALALGVSPAHADPDLDAAVARNTAAVGAIHTLYTKIAFRITTPEGPTPTSESESEYWRDGKVVRIRERDIRGFGGRTREILITGDRQKVVIGHSKTGDDRPFTGLMITRPHEPFGMADVWRLALCGLPPEDAEAKPVLPLADAVRRLRVTRVRTESGPQGPLTRISLTEPDRTYDVWVDPAVNGMIRRFDRSSKFFVVTDGEKTFKTETCRYEVESFREVAPAIFFPAKVVATCDHDGTPIVRQEAEFTDTRVNQKAPPIPLRLPIKAGMPVQDRIQGLAYEAADADGNPAGTPKVMLEGPSRSVEESDPVATDPHEATRESALSRPGTWFLLLAAVFVAAAGVVMYRRRRAA